MTTPERPQDDDGVRCTGVGLLGNDGRSPAAVARAGPLVAATLEGLEVTAL